MTRICSQFIRVGNALPTRVLTLGGNLDSRPQRLILIIPGNPGAAPYYEDFMTGLRKELQEEEEEEKRPRTAIWAISHFGHDLPVHDQELMRQIPKYSENEKLFNLKGQIEHKIKFVDEYVPESCDLTLVGHSIGCKIAKEIMRHFKKGPLEKSRRKIRGYFLFPTIERMKESPSGIKGWIHVAYLVTFWKYVATFLYYFIPKFVLRYLVGWHLGEDSAPSAVPTTLSLLHPNSIENFLSMAHDELNTVKELDIEALKEVVHDVRFYFGTIDGWCPLNYYEEMVTKLDGNVRAQVCQNEIEHAFVIKSSYPMAEIVSEWLKSDS